MGTRNSKLIYLKNGKTLMYSLVEADDGFYFSGEGKNVKLSNSTRNWLWAEQKFNELFKKEVKAHQEKGDYMRDSNNYSGIGDEVHTSTFMRKPAEITPLKTYGMQPYYLGFQVHQNHKQVNGQWFYDTIYYNISWYPTEPITIAITKSMYKQGSGENINQKLSKVVSVDNKKAVDMLVANFKKLYEKEKARVK